MLGISEAATCAVLRVLKTYRLSHSSVRIASILSIWTCYTYSPMISPGYVHKGTHSSITRAAQQSDCTSCTKYIDFVC